MERGAASTCAVEVLLGWLRGCRGIDAPPAYRREKLGSELDFHAVVCKGDGQGLQGFGDLEDAADMPIHVVVKHDGAKLAFFEGRQVFRGFEVRAFARRSAPPIASKTSTSPWKASNRFARRWGWINSEFHQGSCARRPSSTENESAFPFGSADSFRFNEFSLA